MIYNIIIMGVCIVSFFMCVGAYWLGFKHAKSLQGSNNPNIRINPLKTNPKGKKEEELTEELDEMLTATKETMLKHIERGRKGETVG